MTDPDPEYATLEVGRVILHADAFEDSDAISKSYVTNVKSGLDSQLNDLQVNISSARAEAQALVSSENGRAVSVEQQLAGEISNEVNRAQLAEQALDVRIVGEQDRAQASESSLETKLETESARAMASEASLETKLETESARAVASEASLETKLETENARAMASEASLETKIEQETNRAQDVESGKANLSGADFSGAVKLFDYLHFSDNWRVKASVDGARIVFQHKKADGVWRTAVPFICSV